MSKERSDDRREEDWEKFRAAVKPLKKRKPKVAVAKSKISVAKNPAIVPEKTPRHLARVEVALKPAPPQSKKTGWRLDHGTVKQLRLGHIPISSKLDLHGKTQAEAHQALRDLVERGVRIGWRCVLVITGKGSPDPESTRGILRRMVPRWLAASDMADKIIGIETAGPRHGGDGAYYVLLRRAKIKE